MCHFGNMKWFPPIRYACVALMLFTAHAQASEVASTYNEWKNLRDTEAPLPGFAQGYAFLKNHPNWPQEKIIRSRTEAAASLQRPSDIAAFCKEYPPITGRGMLAC